MLTRKFPIILSALLLSQTSFLYAESIGLLVDSNAAVKLAGGFLFTEGPASDENGDIFFNDLPSNRTLKWKHSSGEVSVIRENTGRANGMRFGPDGLLYVCEVEHRRLVSTTRGQNPELVASHYKLNQLNSPNDLWIDETGGIYFTDPRYRDYEGLEQDGYHVYYLDKSSGQLSRVCEDLVKPNGIIGNLANQYLYIADEGDDCIYRYSIERPGVIGDKELFADHNADGLTLDEKGNLYVAGKQVEVFSPLGNHIGTISTPEKPANLTFGGADRKLLFITAQTSIYGVQMRVSGQ